MGLERLLLAVIERERVEMSLTLLISPASQNMEDIKK